MQPKFQNKYTFSFFNLLVIFGRIKFLWKKKKLRCSSSGTWNLNFHETQHFSWLNRSSAFDLIRPTEFINKTHLHLTNKESLIFSNHKNGVCSWNFIICQTKYNKHVELSVTLSQIYIFFPITVQQTFIL